MSAKAGSFRVAYDEFLQEGVLNPQIPDTERYRYIFRWPYFRKPSLLAAARSKGGALIGPNPWYMQTYANARSVLCIIVLVDHPNGACMAIHGIGAQLDWPSFTPTFRLEAI
jgi:hypothetical protein